ncbi:hypothetical protein DB347_00250 [Opitutaceae bacterium EW11]|nr:hypothetical protein DB347_00250 [Opitutaceae bacterium EW11]
MKALHSAERLERAAACSRESRASTRLHSAGICLLLLAVGLAGPSAARATEVQITFQNLAPTSPTGLYNSPVWFGFHDGSFDLFDSGTSAGAAIEALAELGDSSLLHSSFTTWQPLGADFVLKNAGGPGPGLFTPGSTRSFVLDLDPGLQRYLSFGAMVVPSNDSFIANANPLAMALFDGMGNFLGSQSWTFTGASVWDAGTEVNSPSNGAAFIAGVDATLGEDEKGTIHLQPLNGLDADLGQTTPAGTVIGRALTTDPLFRIQVTPVPEPGTYGLLGALALGALMLARSRGRNATDQRNSALIQSRNSLRS